jgi:LCP family protein required for cell wall assembly
VITVAVLVGASLTVYLKYKAVWDSIHHVPVTGLGHRPPKYTNAVNILVFGTDRRSGLTPHQQSALHVGTNQGENNTDTIMVLHISPGHHAVSVLSLPRDTMVPQYACAASRNHPGQLANPSQFVQINGLFATGGASCLWKTVEQQTGIRLDHFIELSFGGFVNVINDLGGVDVCLPFPVDDINSGLRLTKGPHHINGVTALEFWRTRYSIGEGTDLQRISRDQYLLAQVLHGILRSNLLASPVRMVSVVRDTAKAMTTDEGMGQLDMLHLATSLRGLTGNGVQFITAPNQPYPPAPAQVEFKQPQAGRLFKDIAHDTKLPGTGAGNSRAPVAPPVPEARPSQVKVEVLNGSGISKLASQAASALSGRGFQVTGTGDATGPGGVPNYSYTTSVIEYASASDLPAVNTLRKQLSKVSVRQDGALAPGAIELILGSSYSALAPAGSSAAVPTAPVSSPTASASPGHSVTGLATNYGGITGNVSCKGDRAAFRGPNSP